MEIFRLRRKKRDTTISIASGCDSGLAAPNNFYAFMLEEGEGACVNCGAVLLLTDRGLMPARAP